jgi:CBS domain-containing protein
MTRGVISVEQDTPFATVAAALKEYRVSAFPVLSPAGQVVGVVSDADLLAKLALEGNDHMPGMINRFLHRRELRKVRATTAGELMTPLPVTVLPEDTAEHAAWVMHQRRVRHLPVVDADGRLAGIISRADVLSVYGRPDKDIRDEVEADVALSASPADSIGVTVHDGVVTLTGMAGSEAAHGIARRIRHIEGVVDVRDWLSYPRSGSVGFDTAASFPID